MSHFSTLRAGLPIWLILLSVVFFGATGKAYGAEGGSVQIKVEQVGYLPNAAKLAVVTAAAKSFEVKNI
jgi:hypothetical protein